MCIPKSSSKLNSNKNSTTNSKASPQTASSTASTGPAQNQTTARNPSRHNDKSEVKTAKPITASITPVPIGYSAEVDPKLLTCEDLGVQSDKEKAVDVKEKKPPEEKKPKKEDKKEEKKEDKKEDKKDKDKERKTKKDSKEKDKKEKEKEKPKKKQPVVRRAKSQASARENSNRSLYQTILTEQFENAQATPVNVDLARALAPAEQKQAQRPEYDDDESVAFVLEDFDSMVLPPLDAKHCNAETARPPVKRVVSHENERTQEDE